METAWSPPCDSEERKSVAMKLTGMLLTNRSDMLKKNIGQMLLPGMNLVVLDASLEGCPSVELVFLVRKDLVIFIFQECLPVTVLSWLWRASIPRT